MGQQGCWNDAGGRVSKKEGEGSWDLMMATTEAMMCCAVGVDKRRRCSVGDWLEPRISGNWGRGW